MRTPLLAALVLVGCGVSATPEPTPTYRQSKTVVARQAEPNVMLALDRSTAMAPRLGDVKAALADFLPRTTELRTALTLFPADGSSCGFSAPIPEFGNSSAAIATQVGSLTTAGDASALDALLGARQLPDSPSREDFVLLVTSGELGCGATTDQLVQAAKDLRQRQIRTIVVTTGATLPDATVDDRLSQVSRAGGFVLTCPNGSAAECGEGATCGADLFCSRPYVFGSNAQELAAALALLVAKPPESDLHLCRFSVDRLPSASEHATLLLNGVEVAPGPDTWAFTSDAVLFLGRTCSALQRTTVLDPIELELSYFSNP